MVGGVGGWVVIARSFLVVMEGTSGWLMPGGQWVVIVVRVWLVVVGVE